MAGKALGLLLGAVLTAGCGTAVSASHTATAPTQAAKGSVTSSPPPAGTLQQRAAAEAKMILGEFVPPPGAVRLANRPTLPSGGATAGLVYTTVAHATAYWRVRGDATALLAWEKAHITRSFSGQNVIIGPPSWNTLYQLPAVPGMFAAREMNVQCYDTGGGVTVMMADAMVAWEPPRTPSEVVPASVRVVTIADGTMVSPSPKQATITSAPVVRRLAALVNGLPLSTIGSGPCPSGRGFTLTFRDSVSGPPVVVAKGPEGCGTVAFTLNGKHQPDLMVLDQTSYDSTVLKITGLPWKLY